MKKYIYVIVLVAVLATSCRKALPKTLNFSVLIQASPFTESSLPKQGASNLIVITSPEEIVPPIPELSFFDDMLKQLRNMDFENSFAVLFLVGHIPGNGVITEISRENDKVTIKVKDYRIGPGNYVLKGYSQPYQLISVEKAGTWNKDMEFILEEENGNILGRIKHHIP